MTITANDTVYPCGDQTRFAEPSPGIDLRTHMISYFMGQLFNPRTSLEREAEMLEQYARHAILAADTLLRVMEE